MLAESVEDVAMVQSNMLKGLQTADADLTAQSRLTRELQQQLMRVRLVPFANISERLYRVARQAAKELGQARQRSTSAAARTEIDRGVLERMAGPFEHMVRNAIVHGLETPGRAPRPPARPRPASCRSRCGRKATRSSSSSPTTAPGLNLRAHPRARDRARACSRADQDLERPRADGADLRAGLLHRLRGHRTRRPRRRHGRGARRARRRSAAASRSPASPAAARASRCTCR
ncbi:MAG: hypothetical protein MZW92_77650 [Comamonadaceae bacterium]|nr:hypothetical protein [Comamonadaceae bacterium]